MKILEVKFADINGYDNLYFTVDKLSLTNPIYENKKEDEKGYYWVKIYSTGIAQFGYTMYSDPLHDNMKYTWSSNPSTINEVFNLIGTEYELAKYGAGIKNGQNEGTCYWAGELTKSLALQIGETYKDKLHYGIEAWKKIISTK